MGAEEPTHGNSADEITVVHRDGAQILVAPTTEVATDPTLCIFCGGILSGRRSREHVFPRWLMKHYGTTMEPFDVSWAADHDDVIWEQRQSVMGNVVAGRVCRICNNGWMSELEQAASASLLDLASQKRDLAALDTDERRLVARWATKTAFAARSAGPGLSVVQPGELRSLSENSLPSVWVVARQAPTDLGLSWYSTQRWLVTYPESAREEAGNLVGTSHKTLLSVGRLLVAVCHWPNPAWGVAISNVSHIPLWPPETRWLTYPHATDSHGADPTRETEFIDMAIGVRAIHPSSTDEFSQTKVR